MSDKRRWPLADALVVAEEIRVALAPSCEMLEVAGSIRRRKSAVGDIEIIYVSRLATGMFGDDLFPRPGPEADLVIARLLSGGVLAKRPLKDGRTAFGEKNKLLVHLASGIPVDLFSADRRCWFNYLVCRTGGAETNTRIAVAARGRGMKWTPYGPGFEVVCGGGMRRVQMVASERGVFETVRLPYLEPWERP